ncbi:MAG: hypothetical protein IJF83_10900 [Methanobrevibacter sp.]|nr:hypothetical protein [Methanobrevibacter sp.]
MTEMWCKESLKDYVCNLIDGLDDKDYILDKSWGRDFLRIEIELKSDV